MTVQPSLCQIRPENPLHDSDEIHVTINSIHFLTFQLPRILESQVAADINFRGATVFDYTDAINLLACYQGLPNPTKHGRSRSYNFVVNTQKKCYFLTYYKSQNHL